MRSNPNAFLLVLAITLPTPSFGLFAVIQYFKDAFYLLEIVRNLCRQVNYGLLPAFWGIAAPYQHHVFTIRPLVCVDLMGNKAACPERPEQVVELLALLYGIGEYIRKNAATVGFFHQFACKQLAFLG